MPLRSTALLLLLAAGPTLAQHPRPAPAQSQPLRDDGGVVRAQELSAGRVTGSVDIVVPLGETPVTVRSLTPSSAAGQYRIHFAELDVDADGYISRDEAQANPSLADEFISLDVKRRGKLDRDDLAGWLLE
jgi:hypothetical protein